MAFNQKENINSYVFHSKAFFVNFFLLIVFLAIMGVALPLQYNGGSDPNYPVAVLFLLCIIVIVVLFFRHIKNQPVELIIGTESIKMRFINKTVIQISYSDINSLHLSGSFNCVNLKIISLPDLEQYLMTITEFKTAYEIFRKIAGLSNICIPNYSYEEIVIDNQIATKNIHMYINRILLLLILMVIINLPWLAKYFSVLIKIFLNSGIVIGAIICAFFPSWHSIISKDKLENKVSELFNRDFKK